MSYPCSKCGSPTDHFKADPECGVRLAYTGCTDPDCGWSITDREVEAQARDARDHEPTHQQGER